MITTLKRSVELREKQEQTLENDSDRLFLLSLLAPLKLIPEHARFAVKRKVMDVIYSQLNYSTATPALPQPSALFQHQQYPQPSLYPLSTLSHMYIQIIKI